ncbi:hypothetical protein ART_2785 [Arthrobacter sp. PAMC 25486]|uniref:hypothetical protein n=1 Tax=Arthrobacter sp. PAMC 25486 TaxID=1494608 RepID=UPI000535CBA3|nr:hypothetical protein [Arthrobacter sp. PAMC 25486]AIY02384.1 hypothetical protein ART_2785 [Arthrobacter sp. PAMC 25486]
MPAIRASVLVLRKAGSTMSSHEEAIPADSGHEDGSRGRYVQGEYGRAGSEVGHNPGDPEGHYIEGDYGLAGVEEASENAGAGRFVEADYGTAGDVPGRAADDPKGRYVQSDDQDVKQRDEDKDGA